MKLWAGRFSQDTNETANDFNSSLSFDIRFFEYDIEGSIAHAKMLHKINLLSTNEKDSIISGLLSIKKDIKSGDLTLDPTAEDIHMAIEEVLTARIGDAGRKLHTARSRNDQVALDTRMYTRAECNNLIIQLSELCSILLDTSSQHLKTIMPGFTHMQPAQPITLAHHLMAYFEMFSRDIMRMKDCLPRINILPLGSCALAGTGFPIDRSYVAQLLGFDSISYNSIDAVSDRDYLIEFMSAICIVSMHLSRFSEELIIWNTHQFSFVEQDDAFSTGSSIMPQKKNPDIAELIRGKTGRIYGNLFNLLTVMKGLPLAYNKDMQEDKPALFDSIDTISICLDVFCKMFLGLKFSKENMYNNAGSGFTNATDLADYLVLKNIPFRSAHEITGKIVSHCLCTNKNISDLKLKEFKTFSDSINEDIYDFISLEACINRRNTVGGPSQKAVSDSIKKGRLFLNQLSE